MGQFNTVNILILLMNEKNRELTLSPIMLEREVGGIKTAYLSMAHILRWNPIVYDSPQMKNEYLKRLNIYIKIGGWNRRKYECSLLEAYEKMLFEITDINQQHDISYYKNFIIMDLLHIIGYEIPEKYNNRIDLIEKKYIEDFPEVAKEENLLKKIVKGIQEQSGFQTIAKKIQLEEERQYLERIKENIVFQRKTPYGVMVTATMSAGKSTFINSLVGKYVCLSQNMACTSKIHSIINKSFEDGIFYEYDHDLVLTAGKEELLNDNNLNTSDKIYVATYFDGELSNERVIINDSPGVNFSGNNEHKTITRKLIKGKKFNLLIYVMNSTQLATNDEDEHLEFVKQALGRTPVIFIMNKIDSFNIEDENVMEIIYGQREYLSKKGFKNPIVCPVSSKAGFLAKKFKTSTLTKSEERELYNYVDKFEQMNLPDYYHKFYPNIKIQDVEQEEEQLLKTSGLLYVEKIIKEQVRGGK